MLACLKPLPSCHFQNNRHRAEDLVMVFHLARAKYITTIDFGQLITEVRESKEGETSRKAAVLQGSSLLLRGGN